MSIKKKIFIAVLALLVIGGVVWGFMPKPVSVEIAEARRGPMRVTVTEDGKTRVKDRYVISAPVDGYVRRIDLEVGDPVTAGGVVARLEPLPSPVLDPRSLAEARARVRASQATLERARQEVDSARADADYAAKDLARIQALYNAGTVSRDTLDRTETQSRRTKAALDSAEFARAAAKHELEAARTALEYAAQTETGGRTVEVVSPVNGRVLKLFTKSEGAVARGQDLIEVGDVGSLEVETDVLSSDAVRIELGGEVEFTRWGGDDPLKGRVTEIEPVGETDVSALGVEEQRVWVIAEIAEPPERWARLGDGYRVETVFTIWRADDVLFVPDSAVLRHGDGWAVFAVHGGTAKLAPVSIGKRNGRQAQVLEGLEAGAKVILHPGDDIEDGTEVEPMDGDQGQ